MFSLSDPGQRNNINHLNLFRCDRSYLDIAVGLTYKYGDISGADGVEQLLPLGNVVCVSRSVFGHFHLQTRVINGIEDMKATVAFQKQITHIAQWQLYNI